MNIIWNKKELIKIKKIILNRANLKLDEEKMLIDNNNYLTEMSVTDQYAIYGKISEEISNLYYLQDRLEIERILTKAKEVKADPHNKLHFGLISCLSKADPEDHTYIFQILREIAAQYEKTIYNVAYNTLEIYNTSEEMIAKINEIRSNTNKTEQELEIQSSLKEVFNLTNGITEEEIFKPLIEKCDNLIKERLNCYLNQRLAYIVKNEEFQATNDFREHRRNFTTSYQRRNMGSIKTYHKKCH